MNNLIYPNIYPSRSWRNPNIRSYQGSSDNRLLPFLTGAVISAPFWWAARPPVPAPFPYPMPLPYPYPIYGRYPRRRRYGFGRPFNPYF